MTRAVRDVVIVGGGTAGWLTAGVIAAKHKGRMAEGRLRVTLVESPNVATIGVGEGTWPTLRTTLQRMGVSETAFFRECDAAFKQGACFARWTTGEPDDRYYHPLMLPHGFARVNLAPHWLDQNGEQSFCDAVCPQGTLCDEGLAPKTITTPEYQGQANYAYHLDASKFGAFLQRHCTRELGVTHVLADVRSVETAPDGDIAAVRTEQAGRISGDLFVDCTGFSALLIGKTMGVGFRPLDDILFCDRALAVQMPHDSPDAPVASHTISTGQSAGWIWDIGLPTRRGVGYVYSSRHSSEADAEAELRRYLGPAGQAVPIRSIPIRAGHRETFWKRNCVAVGLAAGFLEPLEASAIVLIELSAKLIAEQMPQTREVMDIVARRFNEVALYRWGRIVDFLKLHYVLSRRTERFWRDNRDPATVPERLRDLLTLWQVQSPWFFDEFDRLEEVFPAASYQYVLYGMGFRTAVDKADLSADATVARQMRQENDAATRKLRGHLPRHRDLLRKIAEHGLQPI